LRARGSEVDRRFDAHWLFEMCRDHINKTLKLNPPITNIGQLREYFLQNHADELDEHLT